MALFRNRKRIIYRPPAAQCKVLSISSHYALISENKAENLPQLRREFLEQKENFSKPENREF